MIKKELRNLFDFKEIEGALRSNLEKEYFVLYEKDLSRYFSDAQREKSANRGLKYLDSAGVLKGKTSDLRINEVTWAEIKHFTSPEYLKKLT